MPSPTFTPPSPGLEREEPELATEDDIPTASDDEAEDIDRPTEVQPQQP